MAEQTATRTGVVETLFPPTAGFRSFLVCLDGSQAAEAVLPLAVHLASVDDAHMTLLQVLDGPRRSAEMHATDALEWEIARQEARSYLHRVAGRSRELGARVSSQIAEGEAARGVTAMAAAIAADLVVLSRYGEGGIEDWRVGGTAQKILALIRGAVLVVPPDAQHPAPRVPPRRILVPLDGSLRGESVLPTALRVARASDAELVIAHAVPEPIRSELLQAPDDLALAQALADRQADRAATYLEGIGAQLRTAGVRAATAVCRATDHREGLVALIAGESADLVVVSAHGSVCNPARRFGSVTSHLIAHAPVPVLVIQDLPDQMGGATFAEPPRLPPRSTDAAPDGP
jgi:nucleotide-binding universal stress UspA family protein